MRNYGEAQPQSSSDLPNPGKLTSSEKREFLKRHEEVTRRLKEALKKGPAPLNKGQKRKARSSSSSGLSSGPPRPIPEARRGSKRPATKKVAGKKSRKVMRKNNKKTQKKSRK